MSSRRDFLKGTAAAGLGMSLGGFSVIGCSGGTEEMAHWGPERPLRLLILGGTSFLGPSEVLFHRYAFVLGDFVEANPAFDVTTVREIRFVFDVSEKGVAVIDDLGFAEIAGRE